MTVRWWLQDKKGRTCTECQKQDNSRCADETARKSRLKEQEPRKNCAKKTLVFDQFYFCMVFLSFQRPTVAKEQSCWIATIFCHLMSSLSSWLHCCPRRSLTRQHLVGGDLDITPNMTSVVCVCRSHHMICKYKHVHMDVFAVYMHPLLICLSLRSRHTPHFVIEHNPKNGHIVWYR